MDKRLRGLLESKSKLKVIDYMNSSKFPDERLIVIRRATMVSRNYLLKLVEQEVLVYTRSISTMKFYRLNKDI